MRRLLLLLLLRSAAPSAGNFTAYRLRLASSSLPSGDIYSAAGATWVVEDLRFFGDDQCASAPLDVGQALASVGSSAGRAGLAFDAAANTSWSAACHIGEDASGVCRASFEGGAWLGASVASPVRCVALSHTGAPGGLVLEGWDGAASEWTGIQEFVATPAAQGDSRVFLRRLPGGTCLVQAPPAIRVPGVAGSLYRPAVLRDWAAGDRVWSDDPATWADLGNFTRDSFAYRVQTSRANATSAYTVSNPGGAAMRVYVLSRLGQSPDLSPQDGWEAQCGARVLPAVRVGGSVSRYDLCAATTLWGGTSVTVPPSKGSPVEIFVRAVDALWVPSCAPYTQWRVSALLATVTWDVFELELYGDTACSAKLGSRRADSATSSSPPRAVAVTPGSSPEDARRAIDGLPSTSWTAAYSAEAPAPPRSLWIGVGLAAPEDVQCVRLLQARVGPSGGSQAGAGSSAGNSSQAQALGFALEVWSGQAWGVKQQFGGVPSRSWFSWSNSSDWNMWRLVNADRVAEAWAVVDMAFASDDQCLSPIPGGRAISSDSPARLATEVPKALDGDATTAWVSECSPCAAGTAYVGVAFDAPQAVRCISLRLAPDADYRPTAVRLEYWAPTSNGSHAWKELLEFDGLQAGLQLLTPSWLWPRTRYVVRNSAATLDKWRVAEVKFFADPDCVSRLTGFAVSYDGDTANAEQAYDGDATTFWSADCCRGKSSLQVCTGCAAGEAFMGVGFISNKSAVQCLQMVQGGAVQFRGAPLFFSDSVSLLEWNGLAYDTVYTWDQLPPNEWVVLSVGKPASSLGASISCNDVFAWESCPTNSTASGANTSSNAARAVNCSTYRRMNWCNTTYQSDVDCAGLAMRLACRRSCCLCAEGLPPECGSAPAAKTVALLPFILAGAAVAAVLLLALLAAGVAWRLQLLHRHRGFRRLCRRLDALLGRK